MNDSIVKRSKKAKSIDEVLLGLDYGESKIGLAFGTSGNVMPLEIINSKDVYSAIHKISGIVALNRVTKIVVGLPLSEDSKDNAQSHKVRRFVKLLKHFIKLPVEFVNEYGSSKDAQGHLYAFGTSKNKIRFDDNIAAAIILKEYFNQIEELKS